VPQIRAALIRAMYHMGQSAFAAYDTANAANVV
jgi:hypothetical protein